MKQLDITEYAVYYRTLLSNSENKKNERGTGLVRLISK
jgi:hypothetical protein